MTLSLLVWLSVTLSLSTTGQKRRTLSHSAPSDHQIGKMPRPGVVDVHGNQAHSSRQRDEETMWSIGGRHKILWLLVVPEHMLGVFSSEAPPKSIDATPSRGRRGAVTPLPFMSFCVYTEVHIQKSCLETDHRQGRGDAGEDTRKKTKQGHSPFFSKPLGFCFGLKRNCSIHRLKSSFAYWFSLLFRALFM